MSKYRFKITYRNEDTYGYCRINNTYTVSIIDETLEQAKQKLDEIEKNGYRMHKNILEWEAEEITEYKEIEELENKNEKLNNQLQQKENTIKEVREKLKELKTGSQEVENEWAVDICDIVLEILDKEVN